MPNTNVPVHFYTSRALTVACGEDVNLIGSTTDSPASVTCPGCKRVLALRVLLFTPHIRTYLEQQDPKALEQALEALLARK